MERRELLKAIAALTGTAMIGGTAILSGCTNGAAPAAGLTFSDSDIALMDEIGETILPRTDVPGAKDAEIGRFMERMVNNCYFPEDQQEFHRGLAEIRTRCESEYGSSFLAMTPEQRKALLEQLEQEAREAPYRPLEDRRNQISGSHFYTMLKQLTLFGFFTSEAGATQALRHIATPGRYDGCYPYEKGDRAWAT
ncbi:gluconate 2-dehydrogenase subunit 3 family protein [Marinimicrobium alkaliphilum]|uniref:gluconate 2-dehydrogenase subunit 3 family protein n=1 Tax=Marinimicrobium alkaliphilum TaxID=2202654 RepID=UPI000DB98FF8|nr:gluconate 2-dehydrogenase subunit 3 family protein [Marinimicrobium alkaliphilum]